MLQKLVTTKLRNFKAGSIGNITTSGGRGRRKGGTGRVGAWGF